jgi:hypothetical protein
MELASMTGNSFSIVISAFMFGAYASAGKKGLQNLTYYREKECKVIKSWFQRPTSTLKLLPLLSDRRFGLDIEWNISITFSNFK